MHIPRPGGPPLGTYPRPWVRTCVAGVRSSLAAPPFACDRGALVVRRPAPIGGDSGARGAAWLHRWLHDEAATLVDRCGDWWAWRDSNPRPPPCKVPAHDPSTCVSVCRLGQVSVTVPLRVCVSSGLATRSAVQRSDGSSDWRRLFVVVLERLRLADHLRAEHACRCRREPESNNG